MANGIFDPTFLQGSSMSGESHISRHTAPDIEGALTTLGSAAMNIYGEAVIGSGREKVADVQQTFLDDFEEVKQLKGERGDIANQQEEMRLAGKSEEAVYRQGSDRIKTIESMLESKRLNPFDAKVRIDSEIKKMISKAPFLAGRIKQEFIVGNKGSQFDEVTSTLISAQTKEMQDMSDNSLDPTDPLQVQMFRDIRRTELEAQYLTSQEKVHGVKGGGIAYSYVRSNMNAIMSQASNSLKAFGGDIAAVSEEDRTSAIMEAQSFIDSPEVIVQNYLANLDGVSYTQLPEDVKRRLTSMVKGTGETLRKTLNGSIPREVSENLVNAKQSSIMNTLSVERPALFEMFTYLSKMPPSIATTELQEEFGAGIIKFIEKASSGDHDGLSQDSLKKSGIGNPKAIQDMYAENSTSLTREIEGNGKSLDPEFISNTLDNDFNVMRAISTNPSGFSPKMFDSLIDKINSKEYSRVLEKTSPRQFDMFRKESSRFIKTYARERLAPDMAKELNKSIFTDIKDDSRVSDLVSATVENGILTFIPNTGFSSEVDNFRAIRHAKTLNEKYEARTSSVARAAETLGLSGDENVQQFSLLMFEEPLMMIGEPLRSQGEEVVEPAMTRRQINRELFRIAQQEGLARTGVLDVSYREIANIVLEKDLGTDRLREAINKLRTK